VPPVSRPKFVPVGVRPKPKGRTTGERGYGTAHQRVRKRVLAERPVCERCRDAFSHHLHHRDRDTANRDDANLEALCPACHRAEHAAERADP
jgi:5-methylcytosine-specific restriction endonuclease McrA